MPAELERCVQGVMKNWRENPDKKPKTTEDGKPIKGDKDLRSVAFAICNSRIKSNFEDDEQAIHVLLSGHGPVLAGVALTNRPFLKGLPPVSIVKTEAGEKLRVPFYRYGRFRHPKAPEGKLIFNDAFIDTLMENFRGNVYGQAVLLDKAHKPDEGNLGELERIEIEGDIGVGYFKPTQAGLDAITKRQYLYASMDFYANYEGNQIGMSCSDGGFGELALADEAMADYEESIELFNPYHSKKDGRFTSGKGGSTVSEGEGGKAKKAAKKAAYHAAGAATTGVMAFGGAVIGEAAGYILGGMLGGDQFQKEALGRFTGTLGLVFGGAKGIEAFWGSGAEETKKKWGLSESSVQLADTQKLDSETRKFASVLKSTLDEFISKDKGEVLALDAAKNPGLDKIGFRKKDGKWYVTKDVARKMSKALGDVLSKNGGEENEEEGTKMSDTQEGVVQLTQAEYERLTQDSERLIELRERQEQIELELAEQKARLYRRDVQTFLREQALPVDGRCYSKPVLEVVEALLLNAPTGEGDSIQLSEEDVGSVEALLRYFHDGVRYLLSVVPRDVPVESELEMREKRPPDRVALSAQSEKDAEELAAYVLGVTVKDKED